MNKEETRLTNAKTGGQKGSKAQRYDLIPWEPIALIAEVYAMGAEKYEKHNWRKGYDWGLSYAALVRHITAFWNGEEIDEESGLPHLAHAGFHILALLEFSSGDKYKELDDRYKD